MKKLLLIGLLAAALALPTMGLAEVKAGGGNITLLGHIDFVARFSGQARDDGWEGYDTYNTEFAVLGVAGQLGDNVNWVITEAFAFMPPGASAQSELAGRNRAYNNNAAGANLLDARINWNISEGLMLSVGRFIPPTSMTWNPHLMKVLGTVNYPLLNGSGVAVIHTGAAMLPLPLYQTGVMLTSKSGPVSLMIGSFNGSELAAGPEMGSTVMGVPGLQNLMDIDKGKGTEVKLSYDSPTAHAGAWWYGEDVSFKQWSFATTPPTLDKHYMDASTAQWGLELAAMTQSTILQAQYLYTTINPQDRNAGDLIQYGWYVMAGANLGQTSQIVFRYDYVNYDKNYVFFKDYANEEAATTLGYNRILNPNATLGIDYTWRNVENWDVNTNELAIILEMNLF